MARKRKRKRRKKRPPEPPPTKPCPSTPVDPLTGFAHAKHGNRDPVRVQSWEPARPALDWWNERAGWGLLMFSDDPEIFFDPDSSGTLWSSLPPYESCTIGTKNAYGYYIHHELGHCLGPGHEQPCGIMDGEGLLNPAFDEGLLIQCGYRG